MGHSIPVAVLPIQFWKSHYSRNLIFLFFSSPQKKLKNIRKNQQVQKAVFNHISFKSLKSDIPNLSPTETRSYSFNCFFLTLYFNMWLKPNFGHINMVSK